MHVISLQGTDNEAYSGMDESRSYRCHQSRPRIRGQGSHTAKTGRPWVDGYYVFDYVSIVLLLSFYCLFTLCKIRQPLPVFAYPCQMLLPRRRLHCSPHPSTMSLTFRFKYKHRRLSMLGLELVSYGVVGQTSSPLPPDQASKRDIQQLPTSKLFFLGCYIELISSISITDTIASCDSTWSTGCLSAILSSSRH